MLESLVRAWVFTTVEKLGCLQVVAVCVQGVLGTDLSVCLDLKLALVYTNLCDDSKNTVLIKRDNEFKQKYITTKKCRE